MSGREDVSWQRKFFSLMATVMLVLGSLLIGSTFQTPNASAGSVDHDIGNLDVKWLTDFGRLFLPLTWGTYQTTNDPGSGIGFIGLVVDQDNYDHTPPMDIADSFKTAPYSNVDDFEPVTAVSFVIDDGTTQKSFGSFINNGTGTGDPNDILINQTAWTVINKDWAILQWNVLNQKVVPITNFCLALELPLSQEGAGFGLGGDSGDDIDGYDPINDTYWAQDDGGTTIGFGSAISSDPITHYFSADYATDYDTAKYYYEDEDWLYNRIHAPNGVVGLTPGNRTSTVGWGGITLGIGEARTFTLVIAVNNSFDDMNTAIKDAQYYYKNVATGFLLTEIKDSGSGSAQIEVYNFGREPIDPSAVLSLSANSGPLTTGSWVPNPVPTYGYSVFTTTDLVDSEGDTITLSESGSPIDSVSFGQDGIAPDPLDAGSVARRWDSSIVGYSDDWLGSTSLGPTWTAQNDVGNIVSDLVVINRVMFNPADPAESYVELMFTGPSGSRDITDYKLVCDSEFTVPSVTLDTSNRYYTLTQANYPAGFDLDNGATNGDNVYLYDDSDNLVDMVGWNSDHTQGYFMSRMPDGFGTFQGYNDATSIAAGWVFDQRPTLQLTEFYVDSSSAQIELYNSRGGDKVFASGWTLESSVVGGALTGNWAPSATQIDTGTYSTFTLIPGPTLGDEGDTITLKFGTDIIDEVSFGTYGVAPDPLSGESTARYWDTTLSIYQDMWNREDLETFGAQNDVAIVNTTSDLILTEVMFNPSVVDGGYIVIVGRDPNWNWDINNFILVCDDVYVIPFSAFLGNGDRFILRYNDDVNIQPLFNNMAAFGDNLYLYHPNGELWDMVGWNSAHLQGMSVRRIPDTFGTIDGYDDVSSVAAGWVFDNPLEIQVTEIADDDSSTAQIEVYNPIYPPVDLSVGFTFESTSVGGPLTGSWSAASVGTGNYVTFDLSAPGLASEGDTINFFQNGILIDAVSYGLNGVVPDPLVDESTQRNWNTTFLAYTDQWGRNTTTGPNFGFQNDIPAANFSSAIILNEVLFNPSSPNDAFVEVYNRGAIERDIGGYKILCDSEYIIPSGTVLDVMERFFYMLQPMDMGFFSNLTSTGDNVYLYDTKNTLIDMVGWSSQHNLGESMTRDPEGNGTRDGYDDTSSTAAGWKFNRAPTVRLIKIETVDGKPAISYGHFGEYAIFNLTIFNFQAIADTIDLLNSSQEGWTVEFFDENGTIKISDITIGPGETSRIMVIVTMPDTIPFPVMDNITILIRSTNSQIIGDTIILNPRVYPFLNLTKSVDPDQIYLNGTGHDEIATLTLNLTGMGAQVAVRKYLDTVFCIDSSGSMVWNDPFNVRITESQIFVADNFEGLDRAAIVDFDFYSDLLPAGPLPKPPNPGMNPPAHHLGDVDYAQVIANFNDIDSDGGTTLSMGLNLSNEELRLYGSPTDHILNMIVITDAEDLQAGDITNSLAEADIAAARGVVIFTVGLEIDDPQELQLLEDIANITGGIYFYAPNPSFFSSIYENISSYLADLAVWDNDTTDPDPLVRDVLPPYIDYIPGTFNIVPDVIYVDPATQETILEWNISWIKLGETVSITFDIVSNEAGLKDTNVYAKSRAHFTRWDNTTATVLFPLTQVFVLPPTPLPPRLYIEVAPNNDDIYLYWDEPMSPATDHYLIYRDPSPTGFDFSDPAWKDTSVDLDNGLNLNRRSWNDTGAADSSNPQYYYCIRTVNDLDETSYTSRTVGKWTLDYPAGTSTFSLPLEPLETISPTADFYLIDMNANYVRWMNSTTLKWLKHGDGEVNDAQLEVGRGYEVDFLAPTEYTFVGMPGAMIRYNTATFVGFDYNSDARNLDATADSITADVALTWTQPSSPGLAQYNVYYSTTRNGFHGTEGVDYTFLISTFPGNEMAVHPGVALPGTQYYYMVIPVNSTDFEGTTTYSIGVWTASYSAGYDTMGIPLILSSVQTVDWYCDQIDNVVGMNYFIDSGQRWGWHSTIMPEGAFDPTLDMVVGYQVSTTATTKYSFIGI